MSIEGTRRVMETTSPEVANQYLRFGWNLINQYVVEATADHPATVKFVLASVRRLEDTRRIFISADVEEVNQYLHLGWRLIDKQVTAANSVNGRHETIHFVLAWQSDDQPPVPGTAGAATDRLDPSTTREHDDL